MKNHLIQITKKNTQTILLILTVFLFSNYSASANTSNNQKTDTATIKNSSILADSYFQIDQDQIQIEFGQKNNQDEDIVYFKTYPETTENKTGISNYITQLSSPSKLGLQFKLIDKTNSNNLPQKLKEIEQDFTSPNQPTNFLSQLWSNINNINNQIKNTFSPTKFLDSTPDKLTLNNEKNTASLLNQTDIDDTNLKYYPIKNGLKEEILVQGTSEEIFDKYIYNLQLDPGVILHRAQSDTPFGLTEGTYYFTDKNNNYLAHFLPLIAFDSNNLKTENITMEILPILNQPQQYTIIISIDKNWLVDTSVQYPIRIDPSIVHDTKAEFDTGTLNRLETTSTNRIQLKQHELAADSSTVSLWHMNESTGQVANDASGNGNNGQLGSTTGSDTNDPTWNTTSQKFGASALTFDGIDNYITMGDKDMFSFTDNKFTISFWMKANDTTSNIGIIGKRGSPWEYAIYALSGTMRFETYTSDGAYNVYPLITTNYDTSWTNFTFSADGTSAYVYKNGLLIGTSVKNSSYTMSNTAMELEVGRSGNAGGLRYMNGLIDEVKISNRALSPEEIKQDAQYSPYGTYTSPVIDLNSTSPSFKNFSWNEYGVRTASLENDINTTNLVAQWNFNETNGITAISGGSCGSSCNGTLNSFANTTAQDTTPLSGWTYENRLKYGADGDGSLMFDGVDDYVDAGNNSALNITGDLTLSQWIKINSYPPNGATDWAVISSKTEEDSDAKNTWNLRFNGASTPAGQFYDSNGSTVNNYVAWQMNKCMTLGQWTNIVAVRKIGEGMKIYCNGNLVASSSSASTAYSSTTSHVYIGKQYRSDDYYFPGIIESPKIYSRALSADEINSNYQAGNIEFQTRTGSDTTPEDGGWEEWKSTGTATESVADNMDNNNENTYVYDWFIQNIGKNQNWVKKNNTIPSNSDTTSTDGRIPLGTSGKGDASHTTGPRVIKDGNTYKMWYCGVNGSNILIYYATSPDGLNWTKVDNTIPSGTCDSSGSACPYGNGRLGVGSSGKGDSSSITTAAVIKDGSTYKMWYTASNGTYGQIYYATSSDGLTWTKINNNSPTGTCDSSFTHNTPCSYGDGRLGVGSSGMADSNGASVGNVIKDGNIYKMWYTATNSTYATIAYAYSNDGLTWTKYDNTIPTISDKTGTNGRLSKGNTGTAEANYVNGPFVVKDNATYKMWYVGQDGTFSYALYATSTDGINWNKFDNSKPAVSDSSNTNGRLGNGTTGKSDANKIFSPSVLINNGVYQIWYQGSGPGGTAYRITYASMSSLPYSQTTDSNIKTEGTGSERCLIGQPQADAATVGLWHMEETGGSGAYIKDSSGNSNNGTPTGTTLVNGISGKARNFGSSNYINIGNSSLLSLTSAYTLEGWIYLTSNCSAGSGGLIVSKAQYGSYSGGYDWGCITENGYTNRMYIINQTATGQDTYRSTVSMNTNNWHYIAVTYASNKPKFYIDGQLIAGTFDSGSSMRDAGVNTNNVFLGNDNISPSLGLPGVLDEVRISNIARTAEEIAETYRIGSNYHITRTLSSTINLATTNNKLPFQIASDRPGTSVMLTLGESAYANYEPDVNTIGYWPLEENFSGGTNTMRECTDADPIGTACGGGKKFATGLVAMPSGCANSTNEPTCSGDDSQTKQYSVAYGTNEPADSTTDGLSNTNNLYNSNPPTNPAADYCYELIKSGYNNWYLPSQTELTTLYNQKSTIGGFVSTVMYWTSTEYNSSPYNYSYHVSFITGASSLTAKNTAYRYRCIRQYNSSQYSIKDTSGYNFSGQAVGTSPAQGKFDNGRHFNGTSDYIRIEDPNSVLESFSFTLDAWVKLGALTDGTNDMRIAGKHGLDSSNCGYGYTLYFYRTNKFALATDPTGCGNGTSVFGTTTPILGQWYHVTGTFDGTTAKIYVNGVLEGTSAAPTVDDYPNHFSIGMQYSENQNLYYYLFKGTIDEVRYSNVVRSANDIRQAYEYGLRSHPITIDFGAQLDSGNLITGSGDLSFTIDATKKGLPTKGANLYVGDKIIVRENYNGTEYTAQGTVTSVNQTTGSVTVAAWDSGSTFSSSGQTGYSANADVFKWQKEIASIYSSLAGHRDTINKISLRILDNKQGQNIWLDDLKVATPNITNPITNTIQSTPNRYFQYRALLSTTDTDPTPSVDDVELDFSTVAMNGVSTSQSYINTNNNSAFNIECNGVTDATTSNNVDCEASFNQTNWYTVGSGTTPLSAASIQGNQDISSWLGYPSGNGTATIYVRAHNTTNGDVTGVYNFSIEKDVSRPVVTSITSVASDTSSPYSDGTDDSSTAIVYTASTDATSCRWSTTDQAYAAMTNTCTSTTNCTFSLSGKGQKDVYLRCLDTAGNYSDTSYHLTYYIDIDPDIVAVDAGQSSSDRISLTSDQWFNYTQTGSNDQISFSWTDPSSPSDDTFYYVLNTTAGNFINTGSESGVDSTTNPYLDNITVNEGINYMHIKAKNGVNSWGTERIFIIKYDKTNPSLSANNSSDQWYGNDQSITLSTTDTYSSLNYSKYSWDSNDSTCRSSGTSFNNTDTINITSAGSHILYLCNEDNVGNQGTWSGNYKFDSSTTDIISVDAGSSSSDRTSLTSDQWFNYVQTGSDDQISFSWTDPNSMSDDYFYYLENDSTPNAFNETGLVGWWSFENDNTTMAFDHSNEGNDGILHGSSIMSGQLGNARTFDGTTNYIDAGTNNNLNITGNITVSAWIKKTTSTGGTIIRRDDYDNYTLYADSVASAWFYDASCSGGSPAATVTGTTNIVDNQWHHIIYTRSGTTMKLFVDGKLEDTETAPTAVSCSANAPTFIGAAMNELNNPYNYFEGQIDEVKIYARAFSDQEAHNEYLRRLIIDPYLDNQNVTEGTFIKHIKPMTRANIWGDERYFIEKYDKTAPIIDSITSVAGDNSIPYTDITDDNNTLIVFSSSDNLNNVSQCKWSNTDQAYSAMSNTCTDTSHCTLNLSGEGAKTVYMRCKDNLDNEASTSYTLNYTIDTTPAEVLSITSVAGDSSSPYFDNTDDSNSLVLYTASSDADSCRWSESDQTYGVMTNTCTDTSHCTLNLSGEDTKTVYMRCRDNTGLDSINSYILNYIIDATPPSITSITSIASDTSAIYYDTTDDNSTPILFTSSNDTAECKWSATDQDYDSMPNTCTSTENCTSNLTGQGNKTIYIRCQDNAGNKMTSSQQINYTIDSTTPFVTNIYSVAGDTEAPYVDTTADNHALVSYAASSDATSCKWDTLNINYDTMANTCSSTTNCTLIHNGDGLKTIFFRCIDTAGNKSTNSYQLDYEVDENIGGGGMKTEESSSKPSDTVNLFITLTPDISIPAVNGSVKIRLAQEYDLSSLTIDSVYASGGGVTWTNNEIITSNGIRLANNQPWWIEKTYASGENSIIFPFTGDLNNGGGMLTFTISNLYNPDNVGSYSVSYSIYGNPNGFGNPLETGDGIVHINHVVIVTATVPSYLAFDINPVGTGEIINGSSTNRATLNGHEVNFGVLGSLDNRLAAHDLSVSTNSRDGYIVTIEYDQSMATGLGEYLTDFIGTNANPLPWVSPPGAGIESYFGYTTNDDSLLLSPTNRFSGNKWAGFTTYPQEVAHENHTTENQITRIGYRLQLGNYPEPGTYSTNITYVCTPTF